MPRFRRWQFGLLWFLAVGLLATVARAETVSLMVGGIEKQIYLPVVLADKLGYFRDEGLDVQILSEPAGVEAADEMLAGAVQGVIGFYDHNIELQALGKYTQSVVQFGLAPGEVELVSTRYPEIHGMADMRGRRLGITGLGSSTDFLTAYLVARAGLKPGDVTPVPVGAGDSLIAAMRQDQIQAAMTSEPTVSRLLTSGEARILVDLRSVQGAETALGGPYPSACLYMESTWIAGHRPTVQRLARAFVRTLRYMASHDAEDVADLVPADFYAGGRSLYVAALRQSLGMFSIDGRMPQGAPESVRKVLSLIMPSVAAGEIDLSRTYTNAFVDAVPP